MTQDLPARPRSLANADWLAHPDTQRVLAILNGDGGTARVVGGAVRNALMGYPVADIDIATTLTPQDVMARAGNAGMQTIPTGLAHGTVTVMGGQHGFEVTTLRRDVETFGRRATVAFTDDWTSDASRRDFTINALYCDSDGKVHDPVGGYADLVAARIRFIGNPSSRIREDYLRILRLFRFHAQYGRSGPEAGDLAACVALRAGLKSLSRERVRAELMRLLAAPGAAATLDLMQRLGLLTFILPAAPQLAVFRALTAIEASLGLLPDPALRLAALAVHVSDDGERLAERLTLSNAEAKILKRAGAVIAAIVASPGKVPSEATIQEMVYRHGNDAATRDILFAAARAGAGTAAGATGLSPAGAPTASQALWHTAVNTAQTFVSPRFPISGDDALAIGFKAGPALGKLLQTIESGWVAGRFTDSREQLLIILAETIRKNNSTI